MSDGSASALQPTIPPPRLVPPHPLEGEWLIRVQGVEYGPYSGHELTEFAQEGRLEAHTDVRRINGQTWIAARTDTTLRSLFPNEQKPPVAQSAAAQLPGIAGGQGSTIVQVNNSIQTPQLIPVDTGADKSPGVALLLSLLICGAGQLYNGEIGKGFLMFFACVLLWVVFLGWIINLWSIIDAYSRAKSLRAQHRIFTARFAQG